MTNRGPAKQQWRLKQSRVMIKNKDTARAAKRARRAHRSVKCGPRTDALLNAYVALLKADSWLFIASKTVRQSATGSDSDAVVATRSAVASCLERLQSEAYEMLGRARVG